MGLFIVGFVLGAATTEWAIFLWRLAYGHCDRVPQPRPSSGLSIEWARDNVPVVMPNNCDCIERWVLEGNDVRPGVCIPCPHIGSKP